MVNFYITLLRIHGFLATALWVILPILGIWGVFLAIRKQSVDKFYLRALIFGVQLVVIVEAVIGAILWVDGGWPTRGWLHIILGAVASFFLMGVSAYLREDTSNRAQWIYTSGAFLLFVIALLAYSTG